MNPSLRTELALAKACQNELGHSEHVCSDLHNHTDIEILVQKRVNMFEMYGDIMCQVPTVIYAILAGSLSDKFGRKPLMITSLVGYFLCNIVFLVNSFWFYELKVSFQYYYNLSSKYIQVEYLLLECIQDIIGGSTCFFLAVYSYMSDVSSPEARTRRFTILDSFAFIGRMISLPIGTFIRNNYGFLPLYIAASLIVLFCIIYVVLGLKESVKKEEKDETLFKDTANVTDWCKSFWSLTIIGFKTMFKDRPNRARRWIICFSIAFFMFYALESGSEPIIYLFYRLQYHIDNTIYSNLKTLQDVLVVLAQVFISSDVNIEKYFSLIDCACALDEWIF